MVLPCLFSIVMDSSSSIKTWLEAPAPQETCFMFPSPDSLPIILAQRDLSCFFSLISKISSTIASHPSCYHPQVPATSCLNLLLLDSNMYLSLQTCSFTSNFLWVHQPITASRCPDRRGQADEHKVTKVCLGVPKTLPAFSLTVACPGKSTVLTG